MALKNISTGRNLTQVWYDVFLAQKKRVPHKVNTCRATFLCGRGAHLTPVLLLTKHQNIHTNSINWLCNHKENHILVYNVVCDFIFTVFGLFKNVIFLLSPAVTLILHQCCGPVYTWRDSLKLGNSWLRILVVILNLIDKDILYLL